MESNDATLSILLREGRIGTYLELTQVPPWSINYVCGMRPWALKRSRWRFHQAKGSTWILS